MKKTHNANYEQTTNGDEEGISLRFKTCSHVWFKSLSCPKTTQPNSLSLHDIFCAVLWQICTTLLLLVGSSEGGVTKCHKEQ